MTKVEKAMDRYRRHMAFCRAKPKGKATVLVPGKVTRNKAGKLRYYSRIHVER